MNLRETWQFSSHLFFLRSHKSISQSPLSHQNQCTVNQLLQSLNHRTHNDEMHEDLKQFWSLPGCLRSHLCKTSTFRRKIQKSMAFKHVTKTKHVLEHMLLPHELKVFVASLEEPFESLKPFFFFLCGRTPCTKKRKKQRARFASHCHHG